MLNKKILSIPKFSQQLSIYYKMTTFFSIEDYVEPQWKGNPKHQYYFEVIKQGSVTGNILIKNKSFHLIGKLQDLSDIYIDNPTVSRKHAILQFKQGDLCPYIYDLGSTHGTRVNKTSLPARAYQKLLPYDTLKFGMSSRSYILRCPEVQQALQQQQENRVIQGEKDFMEIISAQNTKLSQQQMKQKYLDLLQNDPYLKVQQKSRKLIGGETKTSKQEGVNWGISDQNEVYAYRNQYQFPIEPDLVRRLPGLDQLQLNKIADFQTNFSKYQEIQSQFNQLCNKQRREFGLEENQRSKKQKLEKKLVQILEHVQKAQQWIRKHLFGQQPISQKPQYKKEKEDDVYEGDEFMDRTIADKINNKNITVTKKKEELTTVDYWQVRKQLQQKIKRRQQLNKVIGISTSASQDMEEEDQLQAYMRQNKNQLDQDNAKLAKEQLMQLTRQISELSNLLSLKQTEIESIQKKIKGIHQSNKDPQMKKIQEKKQQIQRLNNTLKQLEQRQRQRVALNEESVEIFKYYEKQAKQQQQIEAMKRKRQQYDQQNQRQQPNKMVKANNINYPKLNIQRDKKDQQQDYFDLTKN